MSTHANMVKMGVTSVGADPYTITLGAAESGYQHINAAITANATVDILITMGTTWEVARDCTYTYNATPTSCTVTRGTLESSSTGSRITTFDNTAKVSVVATANVFNATENFLGAWGALSGENSITGTATAVIGRLNVCSGTSANYTVTLPAVSGNAGKYIGFSMAAGLTKLVTLDGNASETIDGELTRIMWAKEAALLYCDGTTWTKMAGKTRAMSAISAPSANATITTNNAINLNTAVYDTTGLMCDTANNRITIQRPGIYSITPTVRLNATTTSMGRFYGGVWKNSTQWIVLAETSVYVPSGDSYAIATIAIPYTCAVGDNLTLYGGASAATFPMAGSGDTANTFLAVQELVSW